MGNLRAGYTKRNDGLLQRQFVVDGKRYTVYGRTYKECEAKEQQKRKDILNFDTSNKITLNEYYDIWSNRREGVVKGSTLLRHDGLYNNQIRPLLGYKKINKISRADIYSVQSKLLERGLHTATINDIVALIKEILGCAILDELIYKNPCNGVKPLKRVMPEARETIHRALTDNELNVFFENSKNSIYANLFRFMLLTGVRAGEACALQWKDIDLDKKLIYISKTVAFSKHGHTIHTPKTKKSKRIIPINRSIFELLESQKLISNYILESDYVFPNKQGGYSYPTCVNNTIKRCLNKCIIDDNKIDDFSSHAFRDTFATKAIEAGMKPETLQYILGHADIKMTMNLYYHLTDDKKVQEMNIVDYAFQY